MAMTIEQRSVIPAFPEEVWDRVTSAEGINWELAPFVCMTVPKSMKGKGVRDIRPGEPVGRSWLLLFCFVPFEFDDIVIADLEPARRFRETSTMASMRIWEHERVFRPLPEGTEVSDRVTFQLRWPLSRSSLAESVIARVLASLFRHRHRRLARWFAPGMEKHG